MFSSEIWKIEMLGDWLYVQENRSIGWFVRGPSNGRMDGHEHY